LRDVFRVTDGLTLRPATRDILPAARKPAPAVSLATRRVSVPLRREVGNLLAARRSRRVRSSVIRWRRENPSPNSANVRIRMVPLRARLRQSSSGEEISRPANRRGAGDIACALRAVAPRLAKGLR